MLLHTLTNVAALSEHVQAAGFLTTVKNAILVFLLIVLLIGVVIGFFIGKAFGGRR